MRASLRGNLAGPQTSQLARPAPSCRGPQSRTGPSVLWRHSNTSAWGPRRGFCDIPLLFLLCLLPKCQAGFECWPLLAPPQRAGLLGVLGPEEAPSRGVRLTWTVQTGLARAWQHMPTRTSPVSPWSEERSSWALATHRCGAVCPKVGRRSSEDEERLDVHTGCGRASQAAAPAWVWSGRDGRKCPYPRRPGAMPRVTQVGLVYPDATQGVVGKQAGSPAWRLLPYHSPVPKVSPEVT